MERAAENIRAFHEKRCERGWAEVSDGGFMELAIVPLQRVGDVCAGRHRGVSFDGADGMHTGKSGGRGGNNSCHAENRRKRQESS